MKTQSLAKYAFILAALAALLLFLLCGCNDTVSGASKNPPLESDIESKAEAEINQELEIYSFSLLKAENKNISEDISWEIKEDSVVCKISCVADPETLKNAVISIDSNGKKAEFSGPALNSDGTVDLLLNDSLFVTIYDEIGRYKKYSVKTDYIKTLLPIVKIDVEQGEEIDSKEEYKSALISINCENADGFDPLPQTEVKIKGRGNSTWEWEKKPYQIKFSVKTKVLGMSAAKKWVLLANYNDKSLIRNNVAAAMSLQLGFEYTAKQYPVDVFINGEYMGVYTIGEKIEVADGRVELATSNSADCGMLIEMGGKEDGDIEDLDYFHLDILKHMAVVYPDDEERTREHTAYIKDYMQKTEDAIVSLNGYQDYIDIDSVIDWLIMTELTYNLDCCFRRSCFFTKDAGGLLKMGPVWDYDTSFGNLYKDYDNYKAFASLSQDKGYIRDNWITYLMTDNSFRVRLRDRWDEKKDSLLEAAMSTIDLLYEKIKRSAKSNFKVWDILDKKVGCEPSFVTQYNTYELQVEYLRTFIQDRWNWLDENI